MLEKCVNCGERVVFAKKYEEQPFCSDECISFFRAPKYCPACVDETTAESPGSTHTVNGIGTRLYGGKFKCPTCFSLVQRKWFCILFIPLIPLTKYRIKYNRRSVYFGRKVDPEKERQMELRDYGNQG